MRQGQSLGLSSRAPPAAAASWSQARLWVVRGPLALELGSDRAQASVTKEPGPPRGTVSEAHTGMCSSLYSSCPSSSKFGSASSESSCRRAEGQQRQDTDSAPQFPSSSPDQQPPGSQAFPGLPAPRPVQASLSEGTATPDRSTSLGPKPPTPATCSGST